MKSTHPNVARRGFTLVELLAVIVIIGILASMALYAASRAMVSAKNGRIAMDIKMIETDLQTYFSTKGSYPPDLVFVNGVSPAARQQAIRPHFSKMAPRYVGPMPLTPEVPLISGVDAQQARANIAAEALVFFLGGYSKPPSVNGSSKLLGFRADPTNPFLQNVGQLTTYGAENGWKKGSVGFDETRLVDLDGDGWFEYLPPYGSVPYVYFNAKTYMNPALGTTAVRCEWPGIDGSLVTPYQSDNTQNTSEKFVNSKTFQLLSAGQDSKFTSADPSVARRFPSGSNYTPFDNDNLTNFSEKVLEDAIPQ